MKPRPVSFVAVIAATLIATALPAAAGTLYVPLGDANRIAHLDAATADARVVQWGPVENVHGLALTPDGRTLYAGSQTEQPVVGSESSRPQGVSSDDHAAHHRPSVASGATYSFITRLDAATGEIERRIDVERFTHHVAVTRDGASVIGVQSGAGRLVIVDAATDTVRSYVPVGPAPNYAVPSADGRLVFVSVAGADAVVALDAQTWQRRASIPVGDSPEHMTLSPDGSVLYVVNTASDELSLIDVAALQETVRVATGRTPHGVAYQAAAGTVLVANQGDGTVSRFTPAGEPAGRLTVGPQPYHVAAPADGGFLVTSREVPRMWVLAGAELAVRTSLALPGIGHQVVLAPQGE